MGGTFCGCCSATTCPARKQFSRCGAHDHNHHPPRPRSASRSLPACLLVSLAPPGKLFAGLLLHVRLYRLVLGPRWLPANLTPSTSPPHSAISLVNPTSVRAAAASVWLGTRRERSVRCSLNLQKVPWRLSCRPFAPRNLLATLNMRHIRASGEQTLSAYRP